MTQPADPEPLPREQLRASDADRQAVADRLRIAHDDGRLTLAEYDERVRSAYAARTYADLTRLTADLPDARQPRPVAPVAPAQPARSRPDAGSLVWRIVGSAWFAASALNLLIWGIVCVASGQWVYPWWIWVAGPWGVVLLVGWLSGLGRPERE